MSDDICVVCNGSGEGRHDSEICLRCKGTGSNAKTEELKSYLDMQTALQEDHAEMMGER